ncbi:uncharacterized protein LOC105694973 [Orussus abietinus]|uniref:uncharacterized protein LOC105694973 n=1 Tax=Orussus abietinus TaxID=222816 RepID=UPI000625F431|nr:uncharacterized protein LOC105694973 [Orussus abietinus]
MVPSGGAREDRIHGTHVSASPELSVQEVRKKCPSKKKSDTGEKAIGDGNKVKEEAQREIRIEQEGRRDSQNEGEGRRESQDSQNERNEQRIGAEGDESPRFFECPPSSCPEPEPFIGRAQVCPDEYVPPTCCYIKMQNPCAPCCCEDKPESKAPVCPPKCYPEVPREPSCGCDSCQKSFAERKCCDRYGNVRESHLEKA